MADNCCFWKKIRKLDCKPAAGLAGFVILHARNFWAKFDESVFVSPVEISRACCVVLHERVLLYTVKKASPLSSSSENMAVLPNSLVRQICLLGNSLCDCVFRFRFRLVIPFSKKKKHIILNILIHHLGTELRTHVRDLDSCTQNTPPRAPP